MPMSDSRFAYQDCFAVYERAMTDPQGARLALGTWDRANYFRMRMHKARVIDRRDNAEAYEEGEPMHGRSEYDVFSLSIKEDVEGEFWLYLSKNTENNISADIEMLSEINPALEDDE